MTKVMYASKSIPNGRCPCPARERAGGREARRGARGGRGGAEEERGGGELVEADADAHTRCTMKGSMLTVVGWGEGGREWHVCESGAWQSIDEHMEGRGRVGSNVERRRSSAPAQGRVMKLLCSGSLRRGESGEVVFQQLPGAG